MLSFFRNQRPVTIILLLAILLITRVPLLLLQEDSAEYNILPDTNILISFVLATLLVFIQGLWINSIFSNAQLLSEKSVIPALLWILISLVHPAFWVVSSRGLIVLGIIATLHILYHVSASNITDKQCFHMGIIAGILLLIDPFLSVFAVFLLLVLYNKNPESTRGYILYVFGLLMIIFWGWSFAYLADFQLQWRGRFQSAFGFKMPNIANYTEVTTWSILALYFLGSMAGLSSLLSSASAKRKRNVRTIFLLIIGLTLSFVVASNHDFTRVLTLFVPFVMMLSVSLLIIRKIKLAEVLFGMFVVTILSTLVFRFINIPN